MAYAYSRLLTVDRTKCGTADQANSTVYVIAVHSTLKTAANGGHIRNTTTQVSPAVAMPADLVFSSDPLGATRYPWEIIFYDGVTGQIDAAVMLPTVNGSANGSNSTFYIVYGDAAITTPQNTGSFTPQLAWSIDHKCVLHLSSVTTLTDATGNGNNGANSSMTNAVGQIDGAVKSTSGAGGVSIRLTNNLNAMVGGSAVWTVSLWFKIDNGRGNAPVIWDGEGGTNFTGLELGGSNDFYWGCGQPGANARNSGTNKLNAIIADNVWEKFDIVKTAAGNNGQIYWNGSLYTGGYISGTLGNATNTGGTWLAALHSGGANDFWGTINEYVVRNVAVSADLLRNEFSNQSAAGDIGTPGFLIWGTETANPAAKQPQPFVVT